MVTGTLEIKLPNLEGIVYYPDLSYLKGRKELIEMALKYVKINPPAELKVTQSLLFWDGKGIVSSS
jgi:hypothetical protein